MTGRIIAILLLLVVFWGVSGLMILGVLSGWFMLVGMGAFIGIAHTIANIPESFWNG